MSEDKKHVADVLGDEFTEDKMRAAFMNWTEKRTSSIGDYECKIPINPNQRGDAKWPVAYKQFENWMSLNFEGWFEWRDEHSSFEECKEIFLDFVERSDDFRDSLEDQFQLVDTGGSKVEPDNQDPEEEDESDTHSSNLPEMAEVGLVDEDNDPNYSKVKGSMLHFTRDVDEIVGKHEEASVQEFREAWQRYMMDKFGDEWVTFSLEYTDQETLHKYAEWMFDNSDEIVENVEDKWEVDQEELEGNSDTSQERPGPDSGRDPTGIGDWAEQEGTTDNARPKTGGSTDDNHSGNSSNGTDDSPKSSSSGIGEWAEKEGTTDNARPEKVEESSGSVDTNGKDTGSDSSDADMGTIDGWAAKEGSSGSGLSKVGNERSKRRKKVVTKASETQELRRNHIYHGNSYAMLEKLPDDCVDMVMTSPPYYDLRDYAGDIDARIGGDPECDHTRNKKDVCTECGAWFGQLGREPEPDMFIDHIVELFERIKRVLKPTGTVWLNVGDTYAKERRAGRDNRYNIPQKSMMMVPERIAMNMIDRGWAMRNRINWAKIVMLPDETTEGFANPCSFTDRFNYSDEPLFWFSQQSDYYFDLDAVRREHQSESQRTKQSSESGSKYREKDIDAESHGGMQARASRDDYELNYYHEEGANLPTTWQINPGSSDTIHTAVYNRELCRRPIKAGCPKEVCGQCGTPYFQEEKGCNCSTDDTQPGIVLDPFTGRGTTLKEAAEQGRDYVGIEASEKFIEEAREYVPNTKQQKLI